MTPARRRGLCAVLALLGSGAPWSGVRAQADWRRNAVPVVTLQAWVDGLWRHHALPRALAFEAAARALQARLQARADAGVDAAGAAGADPARQAWRQALRTWAALGAVALGPLAARRSARRIDFAPTRPALVLRALQRVAAGGAVPADEIGGPAKGLGALEWLLWSPEAPQTPAARRYAVFAAADIAAEAQALVHAFGQGLPPAPDDRAAAAAEALNQWIGGLEALRLAGFEKPLADLRQRGPAALPRALSGAAALERQARWHSLQALAVFAPGAVPGAGLVPLETLLRGRGLNLLADRLVQAGAAAGAAVGAAGAPAGTGPAPLQRAARALAALKHLAEADLAPALDVAVGFSDADGD
ncbi:imelysin family protein [Rubrivivax sp. RP6-9]|uniref:imelysin family protein n=1 Tax=Rubrivivax sp. RP6-9 TaxID=3415750 RepID=UPI003CC54B90